MPEQDERAAAFQRIDRFSPDVATSRPGADEASNSPIAREPALASGALFPPATLCGQRDQTVQVGPADRETGVLMKLALELSDEQANRLREGADRLGIEPEQLALAAVMDLIASEGPDFDSAATRVLEKNRELYRRLA